MSQRTVLSSERKGQTRPPLACHPQPAMRLVPVHLLAEWLQSPVQPLCHPLRRPPVQQWHQLQVCWLF